VRGTRRHHRIDEVLRQFTEEVKGLYGPEVLSVVVYGCETSGEYIPARSNINTVILLETVTLANLGRCTKNLRRWSREGIVTPLFLDSVYLRATASAFPAEFLDMRDRHRVLHGADFLATLELNLAHLQFQCEQELKGKLLRLRQLYAVLAGSPDRVRRLLIRSLSSFLALFRSLLRLRGLVPPYSSEEILAKLSELGLPIHAVREVVALKRAGGRPSRQEIEGLFERYMDEIRAAADYVATPMGTR